LKVVVSGLDKIMRNMAIAQTKITAIMAQSLLDEANIILDMAVPQTPWETTQLRESGHVEGPIIDGTKISAIVGFYKFDEEKNFDIAYHVHEDPTAQHKPGTNYKYLEKPFKLREPKIPSDLAKRIRAYAGATVL